jgi:CheY-like chemotaxis protein/HPt (histidine-containing phosphotransfer) domain-containing protein
LGIAAYLVKPVGESDLLQALLTILHGPRRGETLVTRHTLREARGGLRVLVAEDNPVNQALLLRVLEKQGHLPELAHNGREAVALAATGCFDIVLMDVQMPEIDGLAATAAIRDQESRHGTTHIPIYAMTAHALKGDEERCLAAGMDGYISKPVDFARLREVLQQVASRIPESPPWERSRALMQVGGDEELLHETAQLFLHESTGLLAMLHDSLAQSDADAARLAAHRLRGSVGYFAAIPLASLLLRVEELARKPDVAAAAALMPRVEQEFGRLRGALEEYRDSHETADLACR